MYVSFSTISGSPIPPVPRTEFILTAGAGGNITGYDVFLNSEHGKLRQAAKRLSVNPDGTLPPQLGATPKGRYVDQVCPQSVRQSGSPPGSL